MIPYLQVLSNHVLNGLNGNVDLVLSLLLRDEEGTEGELLVRLQLLLSWLETEHFLVLFRDVDLVGDLGLGEVCDLEVLLRAHAGKSRREVQSSLVLKLQVGFSADSYKIKLCS